MSYRRPGKYPDNWMGIATQVKQDANWHCIRCGEYNDLRSGHVLTVHHFDGQKDNCQWWNLLALCQRCHLSVQGRVDPEQPYMFEHAEWIKPYVAGFYADKYLGEDLTRAEIMKRLDELLAMERLA